MIELTAKQKSILKSLGHKLRPLVTIGKEGISPAAVANAESLIAARELIKVRVPAGSADDRQLTATQLAEAVGGVCVAVVGRTAIIYKPNETLPAGKRIDLR